VSGVWSMSPELSQLYGGLLGRADDILGMPLGYSPQALASMFGPQFETIRGQERATGNQIQGGLSNLGMTNTGAGMEMMNQNAWNAQNNISNLMRDLFVKNEDVRRSDLLNNTQLAQSLFGSGLGAEQLTEAINAGRRGKQATSGTNSLRFSRSTEGRRILWDYKKHMPGCSGRRQLPPQRSRAAG